MAKKQVMFRRFNRIIFVHICVQVMEQQTQYFSKLRYENRHKYIFLKAMNSKYAAKNQNLWDVSPGIRSCQSFPIHIVNFLFNLFRVLSSFEQSKQLFIY